MDSFRIFLTKPVEKDISKLDASEKARVEKILEHLYWQGGDVGKPLAGLRFLREKKFDGNRLYFLFYEQWQAVLVVAISDKKAQQATINRIVMEATEHQHYVFTLLKNKGIIWGATP